MLRPRRQAMLRPRRQAMLRPNRPIRLLIKIKRPTTLRTTRPVQQRWEPVPVPMQPTWKINRIASHFNSVDHKATVRNQSLPFQKYAVIIGRFPALAVGPFHLNAPCASKSRQQKSHSSTRIRASNRSIYRLKTIRDRPSNNLSLQSGNTWPPGGQPVAECTGNPC